MLPGRRPNYTNPKAGIAMKWKMRSSPELVKILGIRVRLHYTWLIAFLLIIVDLVTHYSEAYPLWQRIVIGISAALLVFISVNIREFIVIFIAAIKGIAVRSFTLFVFGGVNRVTKEATRPVLELLLALTGLLSYLVIAGIFYAIYLILVNTGNVTIAELIQWVAYINFMLFLFHFIPGFPLDGGRVLRAFMWKATGNYERVTRITSWIGQGISLLAVTGGIATLVTTPDRFIAIFLIFMGWVLWSAAIYSRRLVVLREALQGFRVKDVMSKECPLVSQQSSLGQLIQDNILVTGQHYFFVVDGDKLQGMVTMGDIKPVPRKRWDTTSVGEVMIPACRLETTHPGQPAASLLEQMDELKISQVPVLEGDKVIGIVAMDSLIRLGKIRTDLGCHQRPVQL